MTITRSTGAFVATMCVLSMAAVPTCGPEVTLTTVAYRVHHEDAMVRFYSEAFGFRFRAINTAGIQSQSGELRNLTLKFVPIRDKSEFDAFPIHQLGFNVPSVTDVIEAALRHGGRVQDAPVRDGDRIHAAIREPDGNTIELYGRP